MKATILGIVVASGCAMAPPADREAVEYERIDAQLKATERLEVLKRSCRASGGVVYMTRSRGRTPPTASDMRTARCEMPFSGFLR